MPDPRVRRRARERAMQFLFGLEFTGAPWRAALNAFWETNPSRPGVKRYAHEVVQGVCDDLDTLDKAIDGALHHWAPDRVGRVERAILRIALYEMRHVPDAKQRNRLSSWLVRETAMTLLPLKENLIEDVWQYLPPTKYLLGRRGVATMVENIVREWEPSRLLPTEKPVDASHAARDIYDRVSSRYGTIWLLVFQALLSIAIQVIIDWWFSSVVTRTIIVQWNGDLSDE